MESYCFVVLFAIILAIYGQDTTLAPSTIAKNGTTKLTTTTTLSPNSTTAKSNATTSTITPVPVTTTKPNVTTAAPISPKNDNGTEATKYTYSVRENDNTVCIVADIAVKLVFSYSKTVENKTQRVGIEWNIPQANVSSKSYCGNVTQGLFLTFFEDWEFSMIFNKTATGDKFEVMRTSLSFKESMNRFPNITVSGGTVNTTSTKVMFSWADNTYMKCHSDVEYNGFSNVSAYNSLDHIMTSDVNMNAFLTSNTTSPPTNGGFTYCTADTSVSNIVPIAVGAALAGLVLIVLIAYLIGRSRNQRGYESV